MNYQVVAKDDSVSQNIHHTLIERLSENGWVLSDEPSIVISIGGDGTMLRAIHQYIDILDNVSFIGIHTGTLGFFTNYTIDQIDNLIFDMLNKNPQIQEHRLLEIIIDEKTYYAVNELRIENIYHTQSIDMYINHNFLQTFKGNGICLSTSAGSTGYNRSLGGPIIDGNLELMVLTEIAGIHHREFRSLDSPLVMGNSTNFKMCLSDNASAVIGIDHFIIEPSNKAKILCYLSNKTWKMAIYNNFSYPERLRRAFLE